MLGQKQVVESDEQDVGDCVQLACLGQKAHRAMAVNCCWEHPGPSLGSGWNLGGWTALLLGKPVCALGKETKVLSGCSIPPPPPNEFPSKLAPPETAELAASERRENAITPTLHASPLRPEFRGGARTRFVFFLFIFLSCS